MSIILAKDKVYDTDDYKTKLNNNVMVVGSSGCGKTRGIVEPNIIKNENNMIILDPKGNLSRKYTKYLSHKGYDVKVLDFIHPKYSIGYNFFNYIYNEQDILKISHMIVFSGEKRGTSHDVFWDESAELLLSSIIGYLYFYTPKKDQTLENVQRLVAACTINEDNSNQKTALDVMMENLPEKDHKKFTYKQYFKFRAAAGRTLKSIIISLSSMIGKYDMEDLNKMMAVDTLNLDTFSLTKRALFVVVSDTDRSMDGLVNLFFSQTLDVLCRFADEKCANSRLPRNVNFIMDDFGTNCRIDNFPKIISNIRSRGISCILMLQAEAQLYSAYQEDANTIIANCDTYVYMGGNDLETAKSVAQRCDKPYIDVLNMPIGECIIFRRGANPYFGKNFDLDTLLVRKEPNYER